MQQRAGLQRLYDMVQRYRGLAGSIVQSAFLVLLAALLILVVLPAAVAAQADTIR